MSPAEFIDDPSRFGFLPDLKDAVRRRIVPAHEDCEPLEPEIVARHLMKGGTLGRMDGYEERPGQIAMAKAVVNAFNLREHLMVEAGTGVGKSLAYLVPAMAWADTNDTTVVVSTATRNLQNQLIKSDIPRALRTVKRANFRYALLKGRANYVCLRAVAELFSAGFWAMDESDQALMPGFIEWLKTTPDGDLDCYDGIARSRLNCLGDDCSGRKCPFWRKCFVYRARQNAAESHLVVVNHSLVLADACNPGGGILPPYGRLVIDEAHNLEQIATESFAHEFSVSALARILSRISRTGSGRSARPGGVLAAIDRQLQKGAYRELGTGEEIMRTAKKIVAACKRTLLAAQNLERVAAELLAPESVGDTVRYRTENGQRAYSVRGLFKLYDDAVWDESLVKSAQDRLEEELASLKLLLTGMSVLIGDEDDLAVQLIGIGEQLVAFANDVHFVLSASDGRFAFWAERLRDEKRKAHMRLVGAPLSVGADLKRLVYDVRDSIVMSSATLRVGNDFGYSIRRLGCEERFSAVTAPSPFDYFRQCETVACDFLPDPAMKPFEYSKALAALLPRLFAATAGRALVLFTSYEMMACVAEFAGPALAASGIELLVQGAGAGRDEMTAQLRNATRPTVIFGAQSFWEGVDVAGDALSCVVIARLPFAQVGEPIVEARGEEVARNGGNAFRDYLLPEAVVKFRQGFGRLIRTQQDRGMVVVTDCRLASKSYGARFKRSIPSTVHIAADESSLLERVQDFFDSDPMP